MSTTILMYHEVTDQQESPDSILIPSPDYCLPLNKFAEQIAYLYEQGYKGISPDDLLEPNRREANECLITFDDGYIGNYLHAAPLLARYGYSGVIFVAAKWIGYSERWMAWSHLRELADRGYAIESHTWSHSALEELTDKEIFFELAESKSVIENEIGKAVRFISLPYGSYRENIFAVAAAAGYSGIFISNAHQSISGRLPATFERIAIKEGYSLQTFRDLVANDKWLMMRRRLGQETKDFIKKTIGIQRYRRLYRRAKGMKF
ncbi:MAG TPA: polysaccharide deacetylase family protein [bacterium]|nr:polysaccharide deacetylase family protein [bacterium]HPG82723.1 polysaccharide deacetylase family protein [bacterium]